MGLYSPYPYFFGVTMSKKKYKGKIGYVKDIDLGIKNSRNGHYVYVREENDNKLKVNIITSLEDRKHKLNEDKILKVKKGLLYPIPFKDANFNRWSAFDLTSKNIDKFKILQIGKRNVKRRHKFFVGKYSK